MSFDGPLATNNNFSSGENVIPQGRVPTLIVFRTSKVFVSITLIVPARPLLEYKVFPSELTRTPIGREPFGSMTVFTTL
jgi:hypothetical protein